jgi:gamma-glutamylcyclotransferase (GGCT)/AIG2-like uncharacterized protein YtfP
VEKLFVYGTLRDPILRERITGRSIVSFKHSYLKGFRHETIVLDGIIYPILVEDTNSIAPVEGELIEITQEELTLMDEYEGSEYRRIKIILKDGGKAWTYVK